MQAVGRSAQGVRSRNEDVYTIREDIDLVAVADGMGGAPGGNIASRLVVDEFSDFIEIAETNGQLIGEKHLVTAANLANTVVHNRPTIQPEYAGMGSTLVAAKFDANEVQLCHVGDSRAYSFVKPKLKQITRDHSVIQDMLDAGEVTPEEAEHHHLRSALTQAVGPRPEIDPEITQFVMQEQEILLLCSDGLCGFVPDEEIAEVLHAHGHNLRTAMNVLVQTAVKFGSTDNITVVLAKP